MRPSSCGSPPWHQSTPASRSFLQSEISWDRAASLGFLSDCVSDPTEPRACRLCVVRRCQLFRLQCCPGHPAGSRKFWPIASSRAVVLQSFDGLPAACRETSREARGQLPLRHSRPRRLLPACYRALHEFPALHHVLCRKAPCIIPTTFCLPPAGNGFFEGRGHHVAAPLRHLLRLPFGGFGCQAWDIAWGSSCGGLQKGQVFPLAAFSICVRGFASHNVILVSSSSCVMV